MKTTEQVKAELVSSGISIAAWARAHGFSQIAVHRVMSGKSKARRGNAHKIAVLLGLKSGTIVDL